MSTMPAADHAPELLLASASPRRRELLAQIGVRCDSRAVGIDESPRPGEPPEDYVRRLALAKARAALAAVDRSGGRPVLGADTAVVLDGRLLGKPADRDDAMEMLAALSARCHRVLTAVAVVDGRREQVALSDSEVCFRRIEVAERRAYWETGEGRDKAGAYGIQGYAAVFVERISGSYSGVVGLPLCETQGLLREFGVAVWNGPRGQGA